MTKINNYLGFDIHYAPKRVKKARGAQGTGFHEVGGVCLRKDGRIVKSFWYAHFDFNGFERALERAMACCRARAGLSAPPPAPCWTLMRLPV